MSETIVYLGSWPALICAELIMIDWGEISVFQTFHLEDGEEFAIYSPIKEHNAIQWSHQRILGQDRGRHPSIHQMIY